MHCLGGNKGKRQTCAVTHRTVAYRTVRYDEISQRLAVWFYGGAQKSYGVACQMARRNFLVSGRTFLKMSMGFFPI